MTAPELLLVLLSGAFAGVINVVVGSGTLVTFPVLVALGLDPVVATMSNAVGLVPGNLAGAWGYRRELSGQGPTIARLLPASLAGSLVGAWLLLHLPAETFHAVVPVLVALALVLVVLQPVLQRRLAARRAVAVGTAAAPRPVWGLVVPLVALTGVYGGYFAAAQGVVLLGLLGVLLNEPLQRVNGLKNVLVSGVNVVSGLSFVLVGSHRIEWPAALAIGIGTALGGLVGARYGRRLPPWALRASILVLGVVALVRLLA